MDMGGDFKCAPESRHWYRRLSRRRSTGPPIDNLSGTGSPFLFSNGRQAAKVNAFDSSFEIVFELSSSLGDVFRISIFTEVLYKKLPTRFSKGLRRYAQGGRRPSSRIATASTFAGLSTTQCLHLLTFFPIFLMSLSALWL